MGAPVTCDQPLASISLWLYPLWRCRFRWRGTGTMDHWVADAMSKVCAHSRAMILPSWMPKKALPPYLRLWTSRRSSGRARCSQVIPNAQSRRCPKRKAPCPECRTHENSQGPHQAGSASERGVSHEAHRLGKMACAMRCQGVIVAGKVCPKQKGAARGLSAEPLSLWS